MAGVRLAELCAATSLFTDLGTGQPQEHALRTCLVATRLADALGLDETECRCVYYVSLLRFLGCTAGGVEAEFMAGMAPVTMGSAREELTRLVGLTARGERLPARLRSLAAALADPGAKARLLGAHCEVAVQLATRMGLPAGVAGALGFAYARWDGRGVPSGVAGEQIPVAVRVATVARDVERAMPAPPRPWRCCGTVAGGRMRLRSSTPSWLSVSTSCAAATTPRSGTRSSSPNRRRRRWSTTRGRRTSSARWATSPT